MRALAAAPLLPILLLLMAPLVPPLLLLLLLLLLGRGEVWSGLPCAGCCLCLRLCSRRALVGLLALSSGSGSDGRLAT